MPAQDTEFTLHIQGLDCASCAQTVEKGVSQLSDISFCELNFNTEKMRFRGAADLDSVIARVRELGFDVAEESPAQPNLPVEKPKFLQFMWQSNNTRLALLGAALILPGLILEELLGVQHRFINLLSILALGAAGYPIARSAMQAIRINREININVLMTIAAVGAVLIGAYTEAGMVMVLFAVGEALEGFTASRARFAIKSLMAVVPNQATILRRKGESLRETVVNVETLQIGDVILVKPGERIPMDGDIISGTSAVNQAPITGESRLIDKIAGQAVFAGSINGEGTLEITVTRLVEDNTISRLIKLVEEAQEKRAPTQRFVDRFAKYYTPAVVAIAAMIAVIPPLFLGQPFLNPAPDTFGWLYRGLTMLVVACPCALVISTPVSLISAISNGAKNGVLFKGGAHLETLSRVKAVAFDKTGTLTQGKPSVVAIHSVHCDNCPEGGDRSCAACDDLLALSSAIERRSEHPIARAIVSEATRRGLQDKFQPATEVTALTGRGVTGFVEGQKITIGSHDYFDANIIHPAEICEDATRNAGLGYTPMMVSRGADYLGLVAVADEIRPTSRESVAMLKHLGIEALVMLTGDLAATAQNVARQIGLTDSRAQLLPQDKVSAVQNLKTEYGTVAMVGDGINDAPALATADVGIAIGGAFGGTSQAMETADITLMSDDLRHLPFAFKLSRATMHTIHTNVILSIGIKLAFLALVLMGLGTMWMAVLADVGTSLLVTLNGMRLLNRPSAHQANKSGPLGKTGLT